MNILRPPCFFVTLHDFYIMSGLFYVGVQEEERKKIHDIFFIFMRLSTKYITLIKDMYDNVVTSVRTSNGDTDDFPIKIGLHQGSALSPYILDRKSVV